MKRIVQLGLVVVGLASLTACQNMSNADVGMVTGAVAGGVIGSAVSSGNPAATIGGTLVGGYVGRQAGANWNNY
jgi:uncharacterized protein YcfJ